MNNKAKLFCFTCLWLWLVPVVAQTQRPPLSHTLAVVAPPVQAPGFTLLDMDGEKHSLDDYRGKVVLLNFWATWCPPCRREMPSMERLYRTLGKEGFVVLAVDEFEDEDQVFGFVAQLDLEPGFPLLFDTTSEVARAYGVRGLPSSYILDKQGRIVYKVIGGREFDHPDIVAVLRKLMDAPVLAAGQAAVEASADPVGDSAVAADTGLVDGSP